MYTNVTLAECQQDLIDIQKILYGVKLLMGDEQSHFAALQLVAIADDIASNTSQKIIP